MLPVVSLTSVNIRFEMSPKQNSVTLGMIDYRSTTGDAMCRFYPKKGQIGVDLLAVLS